MFFKDSTCTWSKDDWLSPQLWQTRISFRISFKDSTCAWSKDDWPPTRYDRPGSHLEFFLRIQHPWSKDDWPPQLWQTKISPRIFFKDSPCAWSKDDWTHSPQVWQTRISPTILKFRSSQHMVKDDWPWWRLLHKRPFTCEGNYLLYKHSCSLLDVLFINPLSTAAQRCQRDFSCLYSLGTW